MKASRKYTNNKGYRLCLIHKKNNTIPPERLKTPIKKY